MPLRFTRCDQYDRSSYLTACFGTEAATDREASDRARRRESAGPFFCLTRLPFRLLFVAAPAKPEIASFV